MKRIHASSLLWCGLLLLIVGAAAVKSANGSHADTAAPIRSGIRYTLTDLGNMSPRAINSKGQVVGDDCLWENGKITRLGKLLSNCRASAINDSGQVVGISGSNFVSANTEYNVHAFLWQSSKLTDLGSPSRHTSQLYAFSINNKGQIVGSAYWHPMLWQDGRKIHLPTLVHDPLYSTIACEAQAVNDHGQIVGYARNLKGDQHAVLWQNGHIRDLGTLLSSHNSTAAAISETDEVVGTSTTHGNSVRHAFLWWNGKMRDLGTLPGAADSRAYGVNDSGQVVGQSGERAVIWLGGRIADLNRLLVSGAGWHLQAAQAINSHGKIVGTGEHNGQYRGFLLTPVGNVP